MQAPTLDVLDPLGTLVARLCPLQPSDLADEALIATLCAWRNQYRAAFFDQRETTPESTRTWLEKLQAQPDRIFFLVRSPATDLLVAQYGLRDITDASAELDNGILGVRGGPPLLFQWIQQRVLRFCQEQLGLRSVRAQVLSNNIPALLLHHRCGLKVVGKKVRSSTPEGPDQEVLILERTFA